jgi:WD40 repeat protein
MERSARCPDCGGELSSEPGILGLCPQCLLSLALDESELGAQQTLDGTALGQVLADRYQMRELLGRGGMGEVWRAFDLKLRVDVALKALRPERLSSEKARELLRQEVRSAREVVSPNVCRIFDLVVEDQKELVSMEFIDGVTLADTLRERGPLALEEAREVASQFLSGLEAIHQAGLVHRDFKPENVMVTRSGRVVVMDFGLAKGRDGERTGTIAGTPAYMAPEQARGDAVDARADVFAAGVVLAEMVTVGSPGARQELWEKVRETPPRVPEGAWTPVLKKALAFEPSFRYETARALARALEEVTLRLPGFEDKHPYPGLAFFTEGDREFFFGREVDVEAVWKKLKRPRLLALIGPSGAGKSSFLRAGLLPALPEGFRVILSTPGHRPFSAFAEALVPAFAGDMERIQSFMRFDEPETAVSLFARWRQGSEYGLVVIDQFEELFTLNPPEVQRSFAVLLGKLVLEADVHVLLSMRDDFLFHCQKHESLTPVFSELTPLGALSESSLRRALVQPALACGYRFEDEALVEEMVSEVSRERGALPLLAFAASRLWEKRNREKGLLTREAYQEIGGVAGSLAQHAEETLEKIGPEKTPIVRELFRNLVTAQGTRASRDVQELLSIFSKEEDRKAAEEVLRELVAARLLTSYESTVEIIHESLLSAWPRLLQWRNQDEGGALLRDQLRQAAQVWQERGRPEDLLWTGSSYREYSLWRERYTGGLSALEEAFAEAATKRAGRKRRQRRMAVAFGFIVLLAVLAVVLVSRQQAVHAALRAEAAKLLALAELRFVEDPTEALAFATASLDLADTDEARVFVMKALSESPPAFELVPNSAVAVPDFSPDGKSLATYGVGSLNAKIWSEDGTGPLVLPSQNNSSTDAAWVANDLLVTVYGEIAQLWSLPEGKHVRTIDFGEPSYFQGIQGRLFAETRTSGSSSVWDGLLLRSWELPAGDPKVLGTVDLIELGTQESIFAPDGKSWLYFKGREVYSRPLPVGTGPDHLLARLGGEMADFGVRDRDLLVVDKSGAAHVWSWTSGGPEQETLIPLPDTASYPMLPDPSGRWLSGDPYRDHEVRLWDLTTWSASRPLALRRSGTWWGASRRFHPSGDWVVASTANFTHLTFWPLSKTYPSIIDGYATGFRPVAFSPDGKWLATTWAPGRLRLWPLPEAGTTKFLSLELPEEFDISRLAYDPKGRYVVAIGAGNPVWVVPVDGSTPRNLGGVSKGFSVAAAVSPSGRFVATAFTFGSEEKSLRVWNMETGALRRFPLPQSPSVTDGVSEGWHQGIISLAFADDSTVYTSGDGGLYRWDLETEAHQLLVPAAPGYSMIARFSADAHVAISFQKRINQSSECPGALLHNLSAGTSRELTEFGECSSWHDAAIAVDPSGTVAATGSLDGIVRVGRLSGGKTHVLVGHKGTVEQIAISPDLRWLATAGEDNTLRLWPMPDLTEPPLHTLPHDELLPKLRSLTNFRAVRDPSSANGWMVEIGPFPGWKNLPEW